MPIVEPHGAAGGGVASVTAGDSSITVAGTAADPTVAVAALGITDAKVAAANKDGAAGTASMRTLGTGAQQATAGNDSRLSDARTPTAHATSHQPGGGDAMAVDAAAATGSLRTLGTGAQQAAAGNDARLGNVTTGDYKVSAQAADHGGWLLCNGTAVSRTTYADLFALIGTAFGVGDGSTTFNLPDCRGRTLVALGTHVDVDALGDSDGVAVASRRPSHHHTHSAAQELTTGKYAGGGGLLTTTTSDTSGGTPLDAPAYLVLGSVFVHT